MHILRGKSDRAVTPQVTLFLGNRLELFHQVLKQKKGQTNKKKRNANLSETFLTDHELVNFKNNIVQGNWN